jgi:putative transcriptional regulator
LDEPAFRKITVRHIGSEAPPTAEPISGDEIRRASDERFLVLFYKKEPLNLRFR